MSCYIDRLRNWGWRLGPSAHLIADTNEELHALAVRLGLKRAWFQKTTGAPHYDLTASKRALAVSLGAIELDDRPFHAILRRWREAARAQLLTTDDEGERQRIREHLYR